MYAIWLVTLILLFPSASMAGEQGRIVSLLADYADFRERVLEVREARKSGYASDPTSLITLAGEISEAWITTYKFRYENHKLNPKGNKTDVTTSYMLYAFDAMNQMIQTEIDRYLYLPNSEVPIRLAEKYEAIWKMIDPFIPTVPTIPAQ